MRPGQAAPVFRFFECRYPRYIDVASMRPGQAAPVFDDDFVETLFEERASMRPGQAAPVFRREGSGSPAAGGASMRPGQAAPVFGADEGRLNAQFLGFNEAGAGCPGIPDRRSDFPRSP